MKRTASIANRLFNRLIAAALIAAGVPVGYLAWAWNHALHPGGETFIIKAGTGVSALAAELHRRNIIGETRSFVLLGLLSVSKRQFKAGEYRFRNGINARELLEQVEAGRVVEYPFRIAEGGTFRQVMDDLARAPNLTRSLKGTSDAEIMTRLGAAGVHPEGRFFPDTYFYTTGSSDLMLLQRAYEKMRARLQQEWDNRDPSVPLKAPDEALVLASIVEKETGRADERRMIAGVFVNRLKRRIRLQTDPTVIYGLGVKFDGNLRKKDLLTDAPYNTYTRLGLPPTPIAMPSGESLHAALHPEATRAIFFVSRGDGSHEFSETLEQHNRAVTQYQLGGKAPACCRP